MVKTLQECKDLAAQNHGYADFYQIGMTNLEPSERTEIELRILNEAAKMYESQFTLPIELIEAKQLDILKKLNSVALCLTVHPDNEENSEFEDRITDLEEIIE